MKEKQKFTPTHAMLLTRKDGGFEVTTPVMIVGDEAYTRSDWEHGLTASWLRVPGGKDGWIFRGTATLLPTILIEVGADLPPADAAPPPKKP